MQEVFCFMGKFIVTGGNDLEGELRIHGAKNAVLPILAATVLNGDISIIHDCPKIRDVDTMVLILERMGCKVSREGTTLIVDSSTMNQIRVPEELVREMRSSIILLGSVLSRHKEVLISFPGGCSIGHRPIDMHLKSLEELGVAITEEHGFIHCQADRLRGGQVTLDFPSVGATENVMLAAVFSEGETIISNAAKEPEIIDLQNFLNSMGARVKGAGTNKVVINGVKRLYPTEYTAIPDRIVAGSYLMAAAMTKSKVRLTNTDNEHLLAITARLKEMGCLIREESRSIYLESPEILRPVNIIRTRPYPGYPTDMQAQTMAALTVTSGTSVITENIFESRYKHVEELTRMGANITLEGKTAIIRGVRGLEGADVVAKDLRGGAALVIAGLRAEGMTTVHEAFHVERGYEDIVRDLTILGGDIQKI